MKFLNDDNFILFVKSKILPEQSYEEVGHLIEYRHRLDPNQELKEVNDV
jgi:hypothetical protein